jgi:hypothetical protein
MLAHTVSLIPYSWDIEFHVNYMDEMYNFMKTICPKHIVIG